MRQWKVVKGATEFIDWICVYKDMKESRRISKKILIAGVIEYDSIRKHLADCGYHTVEIRGKYYLWRADV